MISLLDVNILIALGDPAHVHEEAAMRFFSDHAVRSGWATCPLTENAFLRIFGGSGYAGGPKNTAQARRVLLSIKANPGHQFWPDDLSLCDTTSFPMLPDSKALTDFYLLALAIKHSARLATFDRSIDSSLLKGGDAALYLIPA